MTLMIKPLHLSKSLPFMILPEALTLKMVKNKKMMQLHMKITFLASPERRVRLLTKHQQRRSQSKKKMKRLRIRKMKRKVTMRVKKENLPTKPRKMTT